MSQCKATWWTFCVTAAACALAGASHAEELVARVKSDRVNVRARADMAAEVVTQVMADERLAVVSLQNDWVEIAPPDTVDAWAHRDFVKDGVSTVKNLNLRAGPGINYSIIGRLERGASVPVRGQFGEWLKIAPTNVTLWVSREFVELVTPLMGSVPATPAVPVGPAPLPMPEPEPLPGAAPLPTPVPAPPPSVQAPAAVGPPSDLRLVPLEGQGRLVKREGELKPAPFLFGRPSSFRLVRKEGVQLVTVCYVRGNSAQLQSLLNESLIVHGREYWVQGVKQPVIVLERIERRVP
jgi:SH3-like domain-containing protein